jgi:hypothetical protein
MRPVNNRRSLHFSGRHRLLTMLLVMAALMLSAGVAGTASTESRATWQPVSKISIRGAGSEAPAVAGGVAQAEISQVASGCATAQFTKAPGSPFGTGDAPRSIAIGDFNRDGKQDLAVANSRSNSVTIRLGNGAGAFPNARASTVGAGSGPVAVAVKDLNNDGKQDLVVTNFSSDNVTIRLGNGAGGFPDAMASTVSALRRPTSVVIGDFNRDGKPDLAVGNLLDSGLQNLMIRLGDGMGGFPDAMSSTYSVGENAISLAIGDFNRDDQQDLAIVNFGSSLVNCDQCVVIRLGDGRGRFPDARASSFFAGGRPNWVAIGDFNLDGKQDLAVANAGSNNVTIRLGNGAGGFPNALASTIDVGFGPSSIAVGDFNRDARPDLAVTNYSSDNVTIRLGDGAGGFPEAKDATIAVGDGPTAVASGDFNRDGRVDLAMVNFDSDNITILLNACATP